MAYSDKVIDHYENPRNVGSLDKTDENVGTGLVGAPACGDVMRLQIKVTDEGRIEDAKFKTYGCGSAIASSSLVTEWIKGRTIDEALKIKNADIAQHLSLPLSRFIAQSWRRMQSEQRSRIIGKKMITLTESAADRVKNLMTQA